LAQNRIESSDSALPPDSFGTLRRRNSRETPLPRIRRCFLGRGWERSNLILEAAMSCPLKDFAGLRKAFYKINNLIFISLSNLLLQQIPNL
jgi:hypothetical protein